MSRMGDVEIMIRNRTRGVATNELRQRLVDLGQDYERFCDPACPVNGINLDELRWEIEHIRAELQFRDVGQHGIEVSV